MNARGVILTIFIIAVVLTIAFWSKLRFTDQPGYDNPRRWKIEEHPSFK